MTKLGYLVLMLIISFLLSGGYGVYYVKKKLSEPAPIVNTSTATTTDVGTTTPTDITTATNTIEYINEDFGFKVTLPVSWTGYKISTGTVDRGQSVTITPTTSVDDNSREFVPILIYPKSVWLAWEKNNFEDYKTAAPIGPTERGRNSDFVFATAPRYNFSFGTGTEAVENIVKNLKAF